MKHLFLTLPFFCIACEGLQYETTVVPKLDSMVSCTDSVTRSDLSIEAMNSDNTVALVLFEKEGFHAQGAFWGEGMEDNTNVELHVGTNLGRENCSDVVETKYYRGVSDSGSRRVARTVANRGRVLLRLLAYVSTL